MGIVNLSLVMSHSFCLLILPLRVEKKLMGLLTKPVGREFRVTNIEVSDTMGIQGRSQETTVIRKYI